MAKPLKEWLKEAQKLDKEGLEEISHFKFFRDPPRPQFLSSGFILSPADGILIYQNIVEPDEPVVGVKGKYFTLKDLMQKEKYAKKSLVIGIFMCYDEETEVFTNTGWKFFKDLRGDERVLVRSSNGKTKWSMIINRYKYVYDGKMFKIKCSGVDLLVSPDHKIPYLVDSKGNYKFEKIKSLATKDINSSMHYKLPKTFEWEGKDELEFVLPSVLIENYKINTKEIRIKMEDWLAFLGIWMADGYCYENKKSYRVKICQKKEDVKKKIEKLLNKLPFNWYSNDRKDGIRDFIIDSKQLWSYLKQFGGSLNKFIPGEVKSLNVKYLKILLDWLVLGDGWKGARQIQYITISLNLANDVQEIAYKCGYNAEISKKKSKCGGLIKENYNLKQCYCVSIGLEKFKTFGNLIEKSYITEVDYFGNIYDVEVEDEHVIWIRRNNICIWSSNSMWDVHVNRMPFSGFLKYISLPCLRTNNLSMTDFESLLYEEGKIDYDAMDYVFYNERVLNTIYCPSLNYTFYLVQIADRDVDVICHFDDTNEFYYQSDRFSIIRWGSQVDMVFPLPLPYEYELIQEVGWHVEAGLDPLLAFI